MKISDVEAKLAELREEHGDIEVLITHGEGTYGMDCCIITHEVSEGQYPDDWQMPKGFEFVEIMVLD